jgi:hypothetical protein
MRKPFYLLVAFYSLLAVALFGLAIAPGCKFLEPVTTNTPPSTQPTTQPTTQPAQSGTVTDLENAINEVKQIATGLSAIGVPYASYAVIGTSILSLILGAFGVKQTAAKNAALKEASGNAQATSSLATVVAAHSATLPPGVASVALSHAKSLAPNLTLPAV